MITTATLVKNSPRYADWVMVFRSDTVPIESPIACQAELPGLGWQYVYMLDLEHITADQRARLIQHIHDKFKVPISEIEPDLEIMGCPILTSDVITTFDARSLL